MIIINLRSIFVKKLIEKNNKTSLNIKRPKINYNHRLFHILRNKKRLRGYVLLSQAVAHQVPSALKSLTSVFGMGTGVSSLL